MLPTIAQSRTAVVSFLIGLLTSCVWSWFSSPEESSRYVFYNGAVNETRLTGVATWTATATSTTTTVLAEVSDATPTPTTTTVPAEVSDATPTPTRTSTTTPGGLPWSHFSARNGNTDACYSQLKFVPIYDGSTLQQVNVTTVQDCIRACDIDERCNSFAACPDGPPFYNKCLLKDKAFQAPNSEAEEVAQANFRKVSSTDCITHYKVPCIRCEPILPSGYRQFEIKCIGGPGAGGCRFKGNPTAGATTKVSKYTRHFCSDYPSESGGEQGVDEKGQYCLLTNVCLTHGQELVYFSDRDGGLRRSGKGNLRENFEASWHSSSMQISKWAHRISKFSVRFNNSPVPEAGPGVLWEEGLAVVAQSAWWGNTMDCLVNGLVPIFHLLQLFGFQDEQFVVAYLDGELSERWCRREYPECCSAFTVCWEMYNLISPCRPLCPMDRKARLLNPYIDAYASYLERPNLLCFRRALVGLGFLGSDYSSSYAPQGRIGPSYLPFRDFLAKRAGLDASMVVIPGESVKLAWLERRQGSRTIVNREEVRQQVLSRFGIKFNFTEMEPLSFLDRFRLMVNSNVCVSTFGTHFSFAILMRKGSVRVILAWNGHYYTSPDMLKVHRFVSHLGMVVVPPEAFKASKILGEPYPAGTDPNWYKAPYGFPLGARYYLDRNLNLSVRDIEPALEEAFDQVASGFIADGSK